MIFVSSCLECVCVILKTFLEHNEHSVAAFVINGHLTHKSQTDFSYSDEKIQTVINDTFRYLTSEVMTFALHVLPID